ncbi:hypothetical protein SBH91_002690, partial [Pseudomonas putida]
MGADGFGYFGQDRSNPPEGREGDSAPPARTNVYTVLRPISQEAKKRIWLFWFSEQSICDGDAYSPFRPYGESLFVKRDKKVTKKRCAPIIRPLR